MYILYYNLYYIYIYINIYSIVNIEVILMFIKYAFATQNTFFISFYSIPFHFISLCIYLLHHILFKNAISFKDVMHDIDYI